MVPAKERTEGRELGEEVRKKERKKDTSAAENVKGVRVGFEGRREA